MNFDLSLSAEFAALTLTVVYVSYLLVMESFGSRIGKSQIDEEVELRDIVRSFEKRSLLNQRVISKTCRI